MNEKSMKRMGAVLAILFVLVPAFSHAATIAELQAQLQVLMAQLSALQTQTQNTAAPPSDAASCPNLARNLSRSSRGNDVMQLQQFLISQNLLASDSATGFYGALTEAAVKQWQTKQGIASSGSPATTGWGAVGPKSRAALSKCSITAVTATPPVSQPLAQNCSLDGVVMKSGEARSFFTAPSVVSPLVCAAQSRLCTNGILSGEVAYRYPSCSASIIVAPTPVAPPAPTTLTPPTTIQGENSVTAFGAKGDGVTDDTVSFRLALAASNKLIIPSTEKGYKITGTITLDKPITIEGQGKSKIIASATLFKIQSSNVTIKNLAVDMTFAPLGSAALFLDTGLKSLEFVYFQDSEVSQAPHMVLDGDSPSNIVVNLHLDRLTSWSGRDTQILLRDAYAFLFLNNVTLDQARNVGTKINFPQIKLVNNAGARLTDVDISGNAVPSDGGAGVGFVCYFCDAVWLTRVHADNTGGYGIWFEDSKYVYLTDTVASLNTHGGMVFIRSHFITGSNVVIEGRKDHGIPALEQAHGLSLQNVANAQLTNVSSRYNTGVGIVVFNSKDSTLTNVSVLNNGTDYLKDGNQDVVFN